MFVAVVVVVLVNFLVKPQKPPSATTSGSHGIDKDMNSAKVVSHTDSIINELRKHIVSTTTTTRTTT